MSEKITIMSNDKAVFIGKYDPSQARDKNGMWTGSGGGSGGGGRVSTRGGSSGGGGGGSSRGAGGSGKGGGDTGHPKGITKVPKDMKITETKRYDSETHGKYTSQTIQHNRTNYSAKSFTNGEVDIQRISPYDNASYFSARSKDSGKTFKIYNDKGNYTGTTGTGIGETIRELQEVNSNIKPMMSHY